MKENVLDVLMYLFENYYMDEEPDFEPDQESLHMELTEAGFPNQEIHKAFDWLKDLTGNHQQVALIPRMEQAMRLFSREETDRLDPECQGFLIFLEQANILDTASRELVMDRIMALDTVEIDLVQLKWIILMVLFNQPGQEAAYTWIEDLVFESTVGTLH